MKPIKRDLTQEFLMGMFDYDYKKGMLFRKCFSNGLFIGLEAAGSASKANGYRQVEILGVSYLEHRLVWLYVTGVWPKDQLDHINKSRSDNRFSNLRQVDNSENQKNTKLRSSNTTGIMGVHVRTDNHKWTARINHNKKRYVLGCFNDFFEACCARKSAEARFGYHLDHGK